MLGEMIFGTLHGWRVCGRVSVFFIVLGSIVFGVSPSFGATREPVDPPPTVVFWENNFPAADTSAPSRTRLEALTQDAKFSDDDELQKSLALETTRLLVLPYGSVFPEDAASAIRSFLERGGNLLVLGGRPFTRPAYKGSAGWQLRDANQSYARELFLNDYQQTPGSADLTFTPNPDFSFLHIPAFSWKRAWSATVRMSDEALYPREGSAGTIDARLDTLAWGISNERKLSAPLIELDHLQNQFTGGRWILLNAELGADFWSGDAARQLIPQLVHRAAAGAEEFRAEPIWPVFLAGEPTTLKIHWNHFGANPGPIRVEWNCSLTHNAQIAPANDSCSTARDKSFASPAASLEWTPASFPFDAQVVLPAATLPGLRTFDLRLYENNELVATTHTGFWLDDPRYLRDAGKIATNGDYFTLDGKPMLVAGTTYMASDVQRQFLIRPNPYVWDRDMAEIQRAGLNTIRTGWWSGWDQVMKDGEVREDALRSIEAFLMTARAHNLAVQFTFFAFTPDVFAGANPYLDPVAIERQKQLVTAVVQRFRDVPFLSWDLINEPSFSNPQKNWQTRPNNDRFEMHAWNNWLAKKYDSRSALAEAWHSPIVPDADSVALPAESEFSSGAAYEAWPANNSLREMDYMFFAQDAFRDWAQTMRDAIRSTGSKQLVTVGQDEGGGEDRPSPAFFGSALDFTTTHTWWAHDALLWDSLVAKNPGKPMLVQETGVSHEVRIDGSAHRSLDEEAALFSRKLAFGAGAGAGAIEWLWNVNAYMRDDREATIGAIRPDGTEKPEAEVLRRFAQFAIAAAPHLAAAEPPQVAIMTSQALQYSPLGNLAHEAQQKSVRAINYICGVPAEVIPENLAATMLAASAAERPRLVVLPSPQAHSPAAWQALLEYVAGGGNLLISGSIERDAHWRITQRLAALGVPAEPSSLLLRGATQQLGTDSISLSFGSQAQQGAEYLHFSDGATFHQIAKGNGHIFVASYPIELADGLDSAAKLYSWALTQSGIRSPFDGRVPPGILVRPTVLNDSVLYLIVSESANAESLDLRDHATGAQIRLDLPPGSSRLILLDKKSGRSLAQFNN